MIKYQRADDNHPCMGLNNKRCVRKYWSCNKEYERYENRKSICMAE